MSFYVIGAGLSPAEAAATEPKRRYVSLVWSASSTLLLLIFISETSAAAGNSGAIRARKVSVVPYKRNFCLGWEQLGHAKRGSG